LTEKVYAVHTVTGIISLVLPEEIECIPALKKASDAQILAAKAYAVSEYLGEPIKAPEPVEVVPGGGWPVTKQEEETTEDGAVNG